MCSCAISVFPLENVLCGLCVWNYSTERCVDEKSGNVVEKDG